LNTGPVNIYGHFTAKCVYFSHQVALGQAAYGRIAAHGRYVVNVYGQEEGLKTHPGRGQ
jgi:hypothetical protein